MLNSRIEELKNLNRNYDSKIEDIFNSIRILDPFSEPEKSKESLKEIFKSVIYKEALVNNISLQKFIYDCFEYYTFINCGVINYVENTLEQVEKLFWDFEEPRIFLEFIKFKINIKGTRINSNSLIKTHLTKSQNLLLALENLDYSEFCASFVDEIVGITLLYGVKEKEIIEIVRKICREFDRERQKELKLFLLYFLNNQQRLLYTEEDFDKIFSEYFTENFAVRWKIHKIV